MQGNDLPTFSALLTGIGELYGKGFSKFLVEIYWQALKPYDFQDIRQAFQAHIHNPDVGQFFPKPADIVRAIEGSGETRALQAWSLVEKAIKHIGVYQSIVFDDPLIHAVIEEMGGWIALCAMQIDELPFKAREFQKRYMGFMQKAPKRYPKYCCGIAEGENLRLGYAAPPRVIVGDIQKAEQVMLNGGGIPLCIHFEDSLAWEQVLHQKKHSPEPDESNTKQKFLTEPS
jgi:hypothetical protein